MWPLQALSLFVADMQAGIGPLLGGVSSIIVNWSVGDTQIRSAKGF
jgi:hypothetical protein